MVKTMSLHPCAGRAGYGGACVLSHWHTVTCEGDFRWLWPKLVCGQWNLSLTYSSGAALGETCLLSSARVGFQLLAVAGGAPSFSKLCFCNMADGH